MPCVFRFSACTAGYTHLLWYFYLLLMFEKHTSETGLVQYMFCLLHCTVYYNKLRTLNKTTDPNQLSRDVG